MKTRIFTLLLWLSLVGLRLNATTPVTGTLKDLGTGVAQKNTRVRLWLRRCNGNQPRVDGTALIAPTAGTSFFKDLLPDASGNITGTIYSNDLNVECGGAVNVTWYGVQVFVNGVPGPEMAVKALDGVTLNVTSVSPLSVTPVVTPPTGDTTYLRLSPQAPLTSPLQINSTLGVTGNATFGGNATFKGPNPWADVTQYGLVGDGTTDNVAAWNTMITTVCGAGSNVHTLYFPVTTAGKYRFASKPNAVGCEIILQCGNIGAPVQWNPTGVDAAQLLADYDEVTATNAFIDFTGSTSPGNSGIRGCQIYKGLGHTGGTAVKYEGASTSARAGGGPIEDTRISGDGTFAWGLRVDCTNITTAGSQGCRDIAVRNLDIFQTTSGCMSLNDAVHFKWMQGGCFPTSTNAHVDVTGVTGAGGNSTNIDFANVEILDTLALDWVTNFVCSSCYVNNLTATVNTIGSVFEGYTNTTPTIAGQLAYYAFDLSSPAGFGIGLTNSIRATNFLAVGPSVPANIASGDVVGTRLKLDSTGGLVDGQFIMQRSNGSAAGSLFTISFDANGTTPFSFDATNGFVSTKPASAAAYKTATNCSSAASPAVCGSAAAGSFVIAAAGTTVTVNTTAVTANSQIFVQEDESLGTKLGVTCNTGILANPPAISARVAATSFTVSLTAGLAVNPVCFSYFVTN